MTCVMSILFAIQIILKYKYCTTVSNKASDHLQLSENHKCKMSKYIPVKLMMI